MKIRIRYEGRMNNAAIVSKLMGVYEMTGVDNDNKFIYKQRQGKHTIRFYNKNYWKVSISI